MQFEVDHNYGSGVHILHDPFLNSLLTQVSQEHTRQPQLSQLLEFLYLGLLQRVVNRELRTLEVQVATRMTAWHPEQLYQGEITDPQQTVVVVNLARAGTWPSAVCYHRLNYLLNPERIRQDHIMAARQTASNGAVTGAALGASKIGGDVEGTVLLFPDPMGATGSTLKQALDFYRLEVSGKPSKRIGLHLIVTPEYIARLKESNPDFLIYTLRVDRGLSSPRALAAKPGQYWNEERGLNAQDYIVPGAGGLGELLNNSFV